MLKFIFPPMPHFMYCGEKTYQVGDKHPSRKNIGSFDMIAVTRGCHYIEEDGVSYKANAGSLLILRPDRTHYTTEPCHEETHAYWLHFNTLGSWTGTEEDYSGSVLSRPDDKSFRFYIPHFQTLGEPDKIHKIFIQIMEANSNSFPDSRWDEQMLFHELLFHIQERKVDRKINPQLRLAEETAAFLRQHYNEPINYKKLSNLLHFHPNHIANCMKNAFDCTPLEYLMAYRVEQAKRLLIYTNDSIGNIVNQTGFGSFPYFIRCFSKKTGMKPKEFRNQYRLK